MSPLPSLKKDKKRCVLYARYSSDLQHDKSIDDQFASLRERAKQLGWTVVEEYADRALSGTSLRRQSLLRLLDDAKLGKFDVVMAEGLDRISRNQTDSHFFFQSMEFHDVQIYSIADGGFLSAMHVTLRSLQHSEYIRTLGLNVRRGQVGIIKEGRASGRPPYGYRIVRELNQLRGLWEIDDFQSEIVRRIYRELAAGKSALAISRDLNAEGVENSASRHKKWRQEQILGSRRAKRGIARNPIYRGLYVWGKNKTRRAPDGASVMRLTPESDHLVRERPDLRIVDDELWDAVQKKLNTGGTIPFRQRRRPTHLLSGLLLCGLCKQSYVVGAHKRVRCSGHSEMGNCDNSRSVLRAEIENAVFDALGGQLLHDELIEGYIGEYKAAQQREHTDRERISKSLRKREVLLERERKHLLEKVANGKAVGAVGDYILQEIEKRTGELERLREQAGVPTLPTLPHNASDIANRFRSQVAALRDSLSGSGPDVVQAREAIRALIDRVEIMPVGEGNKRGSGAVLLKIEGKLAALVDFAENLSTCSVLLSSNVPTQLDLTNRLWTVNISLRNDLPTVGRHQDKSHILSILQAADAPISMRAIVQQVLHITGEAATSDKTKQKWDRIAACLEYLRRRGIVTVSNVPIQRYRQKFWVLSERQAEFWPSGPPTQDGRHLDTQHVFATLGAASEPMTCRAIVFKMPNSKSLPTKKFNCLITRILGCLKYHKKQGTIRDIALPERGKRVKGWVLVDGENSTKKTK